MLNGYFNQQYWPTNYWPNYWPGGGAVYNVILTLDSVTAALLETANVGMNPTAIGFTAGSALGDGVIGTFPGAANFSATSGLSHASQQAMLSAVALAVSSAFGLSNSQAMQVAIVLVASTSLGLSPITAMQVALNLAQISSILAMGGGEVGGSVALSGSSAFSLQMSKSLLGAMVLNVVALLTPAVQSTLAASEVLAGQATLGATPTIVTQGGLNLAAVTVLQTGSGFPYVATLSMEAQSSLGFSGGCDALAQILLGATSEIIFSLPALVIIRGGFKILVVCAAPELHAKVSAPELHAKVSDN